MVTNKYKNYTGSYEYDSEYDIYHGRILNIDDIVTFQGSTVADTQLQFELAVDDYIEFCEETST